MTTVDKSCFSCQMDKATTAWQQRSTAKI